MMQEKREKQINQIIASVEKAIKKKREIKTNDVIIATMANLNLSRRTASDYVQVAFFKLGLDF